MTTTRKVMAVHDVMFTSNPMYEYEFSWTIEHFSYSPDVLRGPSVPMIPGFTENLQLELQFKRDPHPGNYKYYYSYHVALIDLNVKDNHLVVSGYTSVRNTDGKIFKEATTSNTEFKKTILLLSDNIINALWTSKLPLSQKMNLLDDKLVVKGKLSFSGYNLSSVVSSPIVQENSEACVELMRNFKTLYESGQSSDITFSVGEKKLRAHKIILLSHSPVFAKMFDNDMLERNSKKVVIHDADSNSFNCFLKYLYTGIVEDKKWGTVLSLYSLAHKYQVKTLHAVCSGMLSNSLTNNSVSNVLVLSDLHGDEKLKNVAKVYIRGHFIQVAGTTEWAEIVLSKPLLVSEVLNSMAPQSTMK